MVVSTTPSDLVNRFGTLRYWTDMSLSPSRTSPWICWIGVSVGCYSCKAIKSVSVCKTHKNQQRGSLKLQLLPGSSQLGWLVPGPFLVPALSCPLLSTHQQCPVEPWHCRALYWPCSSHSGTKTPGIGYPSGLVVWTLSLWCSQWVLGLSGRSEERGKGLNQVTV